MKEPPRPAHIHVLNLEESRMWHQPIRPLREFFQHDLIVRVGECARRRGCVKARIYDPEENLLWRSHEHADEGALES
jgi:hypothetical protein